jgi:toxin ParE1/3/4
MAEVLWTKTALKHLEDIRDYVARDSPDRADELIDRLLDAPELLEHTPRMGRRVPEFNLDYLRELVTVRPYRIVYVVREHAVHVVAVLHSRRNVAKLIHPEEFEKL